MLTTHQTIRAQKLSKNVCSIFQRIDSIPKESDNRTVRKVGFICEAETEQEARLGIVQLAANHAAKTGANVLTLFDPQEEAA